MSSITISRLVLYSCALASVWARNVYVMPPNDGVTRTVTVYSADPFARVGSFQASPDAYTAISLANGSKTYVIGRSPTQTVTVVNNSFTVTGTLNTNGGSTDAVLSPDGRRLILVSSSSPLMTIIDTTSDTVLLNTNLPGPAVGVAVTLDGARAYALVPSGNQVVSVDLFNFQVTNIPLPSEVTQSAGIVTGPNGFIYATAINRLFEIDPRSNALTPNGQGLFNGSPGRPQVTPDGSKVLIPMLNPALAQSSLTAIDLNAGVRVGITLALQGVLLDRVRAISGSQALAYSTSSGILYTVNLTAPLSASPLSFGGLPLSGLGNFVASGEVPGAQFAFVAQGNTVYRLAVSAQSQTAQTLPNNAGPVVYTGPASTAAVTNLLAFNSTQLVAPNGTAAPLVVRATDSQGFPVAGATINFATSNVQGATISPASTTTNGEGFALATVTLPSGVSQAQLPFTAATVTNLTQIFVVNIGSGLGGGGGGTGTGRVVLIDGNGLLVRSNSPAPQDMRVRVVDSANNPVPNATITWNITTGGGELLNTTSTLTDTNGIASNRYRAKLLFGALQSFEQALITASSSVGTVTFTQIQIPDLLDGSAANGIQRFAPPPNIFQVFPEGGGSFEIVGPIGGTIRNVVRYQVRAGTGPLLGQGIPGVGVSMRTGFEVSDTQPTPLGPVATCAQDVLSDSTGTVACDLTFDVRSRLGVADPVVVTVGGLFEFRYSLRMTVGPPARIIPARDALNNRDISGDAQTGRANTPLAQPLTAQLRDIADNLLPGAAVRWEVISGSATLTASVTRADIRGLVSTGVTLGNNPGQVRIRVSSVDVPAANFVFTATVSLAFGSIVAVSGDNQAATVQTAFEQPLVVRVLDTEQRPIPGLTVNFASNGGVTLPGTAQTDADGRAQVNVTAGNLAGNYTVTASVGGGSVSFTLNVRNLGPALTSVNNGANNNNDGFIAPCSMVTLNGRNIVPTLSGTRTASGIGRLPFTLEGVSITVNSIPAPMQSVTGDGRGTADSATFQAPCDLLPGSANVTVRSAALEPTSITVRVAPVAPGIYEEVDARGLRRAVVLRPSGAQASATNPAEAGERVRILATGLGLVSPGTATNEPGSGGQIVLADVVIGLNNEGVNATAEYAPGFVGVYFVSFTIPLNTARGAGRPLVIAATGADGVTVYSAASSMDIR